MAIRITDGKIVELDDYGIEERSFEINQIEAEYEEDIPNVSGVVRCTEITIESDAPTRINLEAEVLLFNEFAEMEINVAGDESYHDEARRSLSNRSGVHTSQIEIR